ncbi:MAG: lipid-A-disaccharide synthase [Ignavibacteria bacterium]|nr:lipid-A-disaccharide synthase [Ignavibacteria bacterium]
MINNSKNKSIFIIAGEQSGDANASTIIDELLKTNSEVTITGIGGFELEKAGMKLLYHYREVNYIGLYSVLSNINKIKNVLKKCVEYIKNNPPDIVILVDFPSFNLKFAEKIKEFYKGKIIYYISPQVWVWNTRRVKKIKRLIDKMMVIYPFEIEFYNKFGVDAIYVGNPLLKRVEEFLNTHRKIPNNKKVITILPGSRDEEFRRNLQALENPIKQIKKQLDCNIHLLLSKNINLDKYKKCIDNLGIEIIENTGKNNYNTILNSDLVITKFGTSATECAFLETPFITIYKANPINYLIAKAVVKVKYVTLINIISDSLIVKEFIQKDMTAENICNEALKILNNDTYREQMINKFKQVKKILLEYPVKKSATEIINEYLLRN